MYVNNTYHNAIDQDDKYFECYLEAHLPSMYQVQVEGSLVQKF